MSVFLFLSFLLPFLLSPSLSHSYFIDPNGSMCEFSAHGRISSHRDKVGSFTQADRRDLWDSFLYINLLALIPQTWLLIRSSYQVSRDWKEKNGISGDLLREKAQGLVQLLSKYHCCTTFHSPPTGTLSRSQNPALHLVSKFPALEFPSWHSG